MAFRFFPGKNQEWLEERLDQLNEQEADGAATVAGGTASANFTRQIQASTIETKRKILHDLYRLDPETYPIADSIAPNSTFGIFRDR